MSAGKLEGLKQTLREMDWLSGLSGKLKWLLLDTCLVALSLILAYFLRFLPVQSVIDVAPEGTRAEGLFYLKQCLLVLPVFTLLRVILFHFFGLYRGISRFAGMHELRQAIFAVTAGTLALTLWGMIASWILQGRESVLSMMPEVLRLRVPYQVVAIDWMACILLIGGARMAWRMWSITRFNSSAVIHNVLIIGAGDVGELLARHFLSNPQIGFRPVGFVDDNPAVRGRQIHGLSVLGGIDGLPDFIREQEAVEVLVAQRKPSPRFLSRVVEICEAAHVGFKIVPAVSDVMEDRVSINQIRQVEIEDLLGREPVDLRLSEDMNFLKDEVVLVTGAGGSIGSELCRQVLACEPRQLVLVGRGENSLYEISTELRNQAPEGGLIAVVGDIQDVERMEYVFDTYKPAVVFHAAAHKHVPLMEDHPGEAVKNNIIGTFNVAYLADSHGAKRFTLISSDKAVRPTSVMGVSKRVAEMIVSAMSRESRTAFLSVRFGNVLGSRGSVVPLFRRQIAAGGPVTVTHAEVERYFMTIPEAVNLVLQATAMGKNGQLFLLDMGRPIKILDLARRMITLSGYEPDVDIDIQITGLRPGEKLKEELLTAGENLQPTAHAKIFSTRIEKPTLEKVKNWLKRLSATLEEADGEAVRKGLREIVPEYRADDTTKEKKI